MLKACAEFFLDDTLGETRVVAHHVNFLVLLNGSLPDFGSTFEGTTFTLWLLEIVRVILSKDVAQIDALVDEGRLDELECQIDLIDLTVFMLAKQFAHEED